MKEYSAFPKVPALLEPHPQIVQNHIPGYSFGESYPSAEKQSVYSTAPADWANGDMSSNPGRGCLYTYILQVPVVSWLVTLEIDKANIVQTLDETVYISHSANIFGVRYASNYYLSSYR